MLIKTPANAKFIKDWQAFTKIQVHHQRSDGSPRDRFPNVGEGSGEGELTDADKVIDALPGTTAPNLTGGTSTMLPNHHITKPVFVGEIKGDGQFDVVWKTKGLVPGDAGPSHPLKFRRSGGRLGDPEVRQLQQGHEEVRRGVATSLRG